MFVPSSSWGISSRKKISCLTFLRQRWITSHNLLSRVLPSQPWIRDTHPRGLRWLIWDQRGNPSFWISPAQSGSSLSGSDASIRRKCLGSSKQGRSQSWYCRSKFPFHLEWKVTLCIVILSLLWTLRWQRQELKEDNPLVLCIYGRGIYGFSATPQ